MEENQNQNEGVLIPGEVTEVESRARSQGWVSKEEFDANERNTGKKWRPADEFLERGEIFDTMKSLRQELVSIKRDFNTLADHHKKVAKTEFDNAVKALREQRKIAADEGDTAAVVQISDKLDELKESYKEEQVASAPQQGVHPAFTVWVDANPWYQTDPELRMKADQIAGEYMSMNPGKAFEDVLVHVGKEVKAKHMKTDSRPKVPAVESAGGGIPTKQKGKITKADLNDEEKEVMTMLVKRKVMTEEEYINDLAKVKGL